MKAERVVFPARGLPAIRLEGELLDGGGKPCVISHPHPLAGGDMHHPVVGALWRGAAERGFRALRYNFRGVGGSTGGLTGKSPLALADLAGAVDFLGGGPLFAVGYSYGARCTLHALCAGEPFERSALVALPTRLPRNRAAMSNLLLGRRVRTEEFEPSPDLELLKEAPRPLCVFAGSLDPLVEPEQLLARGIEPWLLDGVNHFFSRRLGNRPPDPADLSALCEAVYAPYGTRFDSPTL